MPSVSAHPEHRQRCCHKGLPLVLATLWLPSTWTVASSLSLALSCLHLISVTILSVLSLTLPPPLFLLCLYFFPLSLLTDPLLFHPGPTSISLISLCVSHLCLPFSSYHFCAFPPLTATKGHCESLLQFPGSFSCCGTLTFLVFKYICLYII